VAWLKIPCSMENCGPYLSYAQFTSKEVLLCPTEHNWQTRRQTQQQTDNITQWTRLT